MSESAGPQPAPPRQPGLREADEPPWRGAFGAEAEVPDEIAGEPPLAVLSSALPPEALPEELAAPDAPAAHAAPSRRRRRHRSGVLPSLVTAADIPEDAEGRVVFYVLAPPPDASVAEPLPAAMAEAEPGPLEEALTRVTTAPMRLFLRGGVAGWAPVVLLAVVFLAVFVAGMRLAR